MPAVAEVGRKSLQPEVHWVFSWGSWTWITGPLAVSGCTGSWEGVGSDLCLHIGPLLAVVAAVTHLWGQR